MNSFKEIESYVAKRKGGKAALERLLNVTKPLQPASLASITDDRVLSTMTRRVFISGFSAKVVDAKWEALETAFSNFDPHFCAALSGKQIDELANNPTIIRNRAKIRSVPVNARFILDLTHSNGTAGSFFSKWPDAEYVKLLHILKRRGSHLGGVSGMRFLRMLGKPAFITSTDVVAALIREGVVDASPSGKRELEKIQQAFNRWSDETGRNLTDLSRILAMSVNSDDFRANPKHQA